MTQVENPFVDDDAVEVDESREPVSLGDAAQSALGEIAEQDGAARETLEGTDYTKIKFVGMSFDTLDTDVKIGDEMEFVVRGRVKGVADEEDAKGNVNHVAKVKVSSVQPTKGVPEA